jgi:hypothetical protein
MHGEIRLFAALLIVFEGSIFIETQWNSADNNPETASRACLSVMQQLLG